MNEIEQLRHDLEFQFVEKRNDWEAFLVEINKSVQKFNPSIEEKELYTYDTLCKSILDISLDLTKLEEYKTALSSSILREIYKRLVLNKARDAKIAIIPKTSAKLN